MAEGKTVKNDIFRSIWYALRANWIMILAIVLAVTVIGGIVSFIKKPVYTSREKAIYSATLTYNSTTTYDMTATKAYLDTFADFCKAGVVIERADYYYEKFSENRSQYTNVDDFIKKQRITEYGTSCSSYDELIENPDKFVGKTIVINSKGVLYTLGKTSKMTQQYLGVFYGIEDRFDRINESDIEEVKVKCIKITVADGDQTDFRYLRLKDFYYKEGSEYVKRELDWIIKNDYRYSSLSGYSLISDVEIHENFTSKHTDKSFYNVDKIGVSASSFKDDEISYTMTVSYTDTNQQATKDMTKLLVFAIDMESNIYVPYKDSTDNKDYPLISSSKYFGVKVNFYDLGLSGVTVDITKAKIILIFFFVGIVIALIAVYVKGRVDVTVKTKEELEGITGVNCLSMVDSKPKSKEDGV